MSKWLQLIQERRGGRVDERVDQLKNQLKELLERENAKWLLQTATDGERERKRGQVFLPNFTLQLLTQELPV